MAERSRVPGERKQTAIHARRRRRLSRQLVSTGPFRASDAGRANNIVVKAGRTSPRGRDDAAPSSDSIDSLGQRLRVPRSLFALGPSPGPEETTGESDPDPQGCHGFLGKSDGATRIGVFVPASRGETELGCLLALSALNIDTPARRSARGVSVCLRSRLTRETRRGRRGRRIKPRNFNGPVPAGLRCLTIEICCSL